MDINSVSSSAARFSWSPSGKDRNGDGSVTREEFMLPVDDGQTAITPADLRAGGSLSDQFAHYDRNGDGVISGSELQGTLAFLGTSPDRFTPGWDLGMTDEERAAYIAKVQADNSRVTVQWLASRYDASKG